MVIIYDSFIKLYRNITNWGWYTNVNIARLFIHWIIKANYVEKEWQGIKISAGSFVTSYSKLAQKLDLTVDKIRTAISHLISTHEITHKKTRQYSIITKTNYNLSQQNPKQNPFKIPNDSQTNSNN